MPIYEYRCSQGHQYERWEGFDAPVEQECPNCGRTARRLFSPPAIIFKGPGFYSTDHRKNGHHSQESESKEEAKAESASS